MSAERHEETFPGLTRELLDSLPVLAFQVDRELRVLPGACGGSRPKDGGERLVAAGTRVEDVFGSNSRLRILIEAALSGGVRSTLDEPLEDRTLQVAVGPRTNDAGEVVGASVLAIDVTEAREASSQLSTRDAQLRLLVDTALDAVITCDAKSRIVDWNAGAERLFGWTHDEALGRLLTETVVPEDLRAAHDAGMKRFLATGEGPVLGRRIQIEAIDRTGRRFPIELAINPIPTPTGMMFSAFLRDISDRIDAERRLAGSEYRLRGALDAMRAGAWDLQIDAGGRVTRAEADERCLELLGEDGREIPAGRRQLHPDDRELVARAWMAHLSGFEPRYDIEYRVVDEDGAIGWRRDLGMLVGEGGEGDGAPEFPGQVKAARRVIGVVTDVTEAHELADSLAAARKLEAVGQVAASFAHDLNNVLAAVIGHATLAATVPGLPEKAIASLDTIKEAVARGRTATQNMLMLGRPGRLKRDRVEVAAVVSETEALAAPILGEDMSFTTEVDPDLPVVECDANQLQQAVLNLLINARDATERRGRVEVHATRTDECDHRGRPLICIEVADDGPGMTPEVMEAAVQPFYTTKGKNGTGLGLAMVDAFATETGGRLEIESAPGAGTRIRILIPAARGAIAVGTPSVHETPPGSAPDPAEARILVIEDHPLLRPMLVEALAHGGYHAEGVPNGDEALDTGLEPVPDAMVVDINLPGRRGDEVVAEIRERTGRAIPVLFVTGNADFQVPRWPAVGLLRKPFELHELGERVADLLAASRG